MFYDADWDYQINSGEFTTSAYVRFNKVDYPVSVILSKAFSRPEAEGRLLVDIPQEVLSVTVYASSLPDGVLAKDFSYLLFTIDGVVYEVSSVVGTDVLRFFLKRAAEFDDDDDELPRDPASDAVVEED